jgi:hypothetical protein
MGMEVNLINAKYSDIDGRGLVFFEILEEGVVNIPTALVCECAYHNIDISWQLSFHPVRYIDWLSLTELKWQRTYTGIDPTGSSFPTATRLASLLN